MIVSTQTEPLWHAPFLAMLPTIQRQAESSFGYLRGANRDEAIQATIVNTCVAFARLYHQGRTDRAFPTVLARFAIRQVRAGRQTGTKQNCRDVLSPLARLQKHFTVEHLDHFDTDMQEWGEAVVEDTRTPVIDQVCFRIDFPDWLRSLSVRDRRLALLLVVGNTTTDAARQFGISLSRVSQLRRELHDSWQIFHGENQSAPPTAV